MKRCLAILLLAALGSGGCMSYNSSPGPHTTEQLDLPQAPILTAAR